MTIFDFLARCFLETRSLEQDVHPKLDGGICYLSVSPSPGATRPPLQARPALDKLTVGQHFQTRQQEDFRIDREIKSRVKSEL